jgi:hypothetical protein
MQVREEDLGTTEGAAEGNQGEGSQTGCLLLCLKVGSQPPFFLQEIH